MDMQNTEKIAPLDRKRLKWFIKQQVRIGKETENDWEFFSQSNEEYLQNLYQKDETDPKTRLYWVDKDIKGFITAKVVKSISQDELFVKALKPPFGMMAPPIVRPRNRKIERSLIEAAIETLQKQKVKAIVCNVSPSWEIHHLLEEFDFYPKDTLLHRSILDVSSLPEVASKMAIDCTNANNDEKAELLSDNLGYSLDFAARILINPPVDEYRDIGIRKGNLKAWARISRIKNQWRMGPVYSQGIDIESSKAILCQIKKILAEKSVDQLTILCSKQGKHLLRNFGKDIEFHSAIITYIKQIEA